LVGKVHIYMKLKGWTFQRIAYILDSNF